jgi:hypothetical protein
VSTARKKSAGKTARRPTRTRKLAPPASAMAYAKLREEIIDCVRSPGE